MTTFSQTLAISHIITTIAFVMTAFVVTMTSLSETEQKPLIQVKIFLTPLITFMPILRC